MKEFKARSRALSAVYTLSSASGDPAVTAPLPPAAAHRRRTERAEIKFYFIGDTIHEYD